MKTPRTSPELSSAATAIVDRILDAFAELNQEEPFVTAGLADQLRLIARDHRDIDRPALLAELGRAVRGCEEGMQADADRFGYAIDWDGLLAKERDCVRVLP